MLTCFPECTHDDMPILKLNHDCTAGASRMRWLSRVLAAIVLVSFCGYVMADTATDAAIPILVSQMGFIGGLGIGLRVLVLLIVLMVLPLKSVLATVYYVRKTGDNSNAGTSTGAAWKTITKATSSTSAGDIVYFGAGTYSEDVEPSVDGTSGSPIRFVADSSGLMTGDAGDVTVVAIGGKGSKALSIQEDDYLEFEGFHISGNGKEGIKAKDSDGFVLRNCEIYGSKQGFKIEGTGDTLIVNCLIRDNSAQAFDIKGSGTVSIWNCTIVENAWGGVSIKESVVCTVKNSIIANNGYEGFYREAGTLTHTHNVVYGNSTNFSGTSQDSSEYVSDPLFEDSANDDYRLQTSSPAIDNGTDASGIVDIDLDDYYRPISTAWDIGCYETCLVGPVLMVTSDDVSPSAQDVTKLLLIQSWGYCVNLIDDDDLQATFDTALASNWVAYVSEEVNASSLGSKLSAAKIGVVNEAADMVDDFGFASSGTVSTQTTLTVENASHYITASFIEGDYSIFDSSSPAVTVGGIVSREIMALGEIGSSQSLITLDIGTERYDSGTVAGRRVQLPWGGDAFDIDDLSTDGQTIMLRSIEWAHGVIGYWTFDESSGTTVYDSSGNGNDGLLHNQTFASDSVSPAKLADGLDFDGTTGFVSINHDPTLQPTGALSITAWIKGDAWTSGSEVNTILRKGNSDPHNYQLAIADGKLTLSLDNSDGSGIQGDTVLDTGRWYHVAATWDGSTVKLYVDGVLDNSPGDTHSGPIATDERKVRIGGASTTDFFDGTIDDVRFYNYALDATEAKSVKGIGQPRGVRITKWVEIE